MVTSFLKEGPGPIIVWTFEHDRGPRGVRRSCPRVRGHARRMGLMGPSGPGIGQRGGFDDAGAVGRELRKVRP